MQPKESDVSRAFLAKYATTPGFLLKRDTFGSDDQVPLGINCVLWRVNTLQARGPSGQPVKSVPTGHSDFAGFLRGGRAVYIELKSPTGRPRPEQLNFERLARNLGALYIRTCVPDEAMAILLKEVAIND